MMQELSLKKGEADPSQDLQIQSTAVAGSCARGCPNFTSKAASRAALLLHFMSSPNVLITCNIYYY